jgi:hypothetical protein
MDFLPLEFPDKNVRKQLPTLKLLKPTTSSLLEITESQFLTITEQRKASNNKFASLLMFQSDAEKRFARSFGEASAVLNQLEDLQKRRDERNKLYEAIKSSTATKEEKSIYEKSKNLEKELEATYKKEQQLSADTERNYEKVDKAKAALKEHALAEFHSHVFEVIQFFYFPLAKHVVL